MNLVNGAGALRKTPLGQGRSFLTPCCSGRSFRRLLSVSTRRSNEARRGLPGTEKSSNDASRRSSASQPPIAVLGAGLSGLTVALRLSRALPHRRIVIFESSSRLGGWVKSERIPIAGGPGEVVLESGPRSIRPKGAPGWSMIELIHSLGLMDQLLVVPSSSPSAKNRFIWYGSQLNQLPSSLLGFLGALVRLPVLRSLFPAVIPGVLKEPFRPSQFARPKSESAVEVTRQREREYLLDESVESFIKRRFGDAFGGRLINNVLSAVLHGIYAASTKDLSVRSTLAMLWKTESRHGSLLRALLPPRFNKRYRAPTQAEEAASKAEHEEVEKARAAVGSEWARRLDKASVMSLKDGLQGIVTAMVSSLEAQRNVSFRLEENVTGFLKDDQSGATFLRTSSGEDVAVDRVVSALPSTALAYLLQQDVEPTKRALQASATSILSILRHNPSTDVAVVSFAIPTSARAVDSKGRILPVDEGFGFLVPRSETPSNSDGILGVVFDSDAIPGQDTAEGVTKLTVMMGGPHFKGLSPLPSSEECRQRAIRALERFLGIPSTVTEHPDTIVRSQVQPKCIPTYLPGHFSRMRRLHEELTQLSERQGFPLTVTGASYTGVSVNDVVMEATRTAHRIAEADAEAKQAGRDGRSGAVTGLESFKQG